MIFVSGKFISLQFSPQLSYTLIGAFVTTYLLEKTRVCFQVCLSSPCQTSFPLPAPAPTSAEGDAGVLVAPCNLSLSLVNLFSRILCSCSQMTGERNYHIFYDLLSGAGSNGQLCLDPDPMEYFYLSQSVERGKVPEGGEKGMFDHVCHAMEVIGVDEGQRAELWKILSGILHLGNVKMMEVDTVEGLKAAIEDPRHAALAANMLGVETETLTELLTVRRTNVRDQEIVIKLQQSESAFRRDAVSKALYDGIFSWIVDMANDHLGYKRGETLPFIGVLDIFGFESFKVNGLEQILINFANEYLQNVFNKQVIAWLRASWNRPRCVCPI